jgi:hypothetical protein
MQMYALARKTSSSVVNRTTVSLINAHCLSSLAGLAVVGLECSVDSDLTLVASTPSGEAGLGLETDGKAVYAI